MRTGGVGWSKMAKFLRTYYVHSPLSKSKYTFWVRNPKGKRKTGVKIFGAEENNEGRRARGTTTKPCDVKYEKIQFSLFPNDKNGCNAEFNLTDNDC